MQFPRLCNFKLFDDLSDDTIVIQIRVMLRDQDVFEYASPEAVYCVDAVIDYNHTHTCYGLQIRQRVRIITLLHVNIWANESWEQWILE